MSFKLGDQVCVTLGGGERSPWHKATATVIKVDEVDGRKMYFIQKNTNSKLRRPQRSVAWEHELKRAEGAPCNGD